MKFNKQKAYDFIIQKVQSELDGLKKEAYKSSHEYTTNEESQAE